jgi:hypothetical protein
MSQQSARLSGGRAPHPQKKMDRRGVPSLGSVLWFLWMLGMWVGFFVLLRLDRIDSVWSWVRDLPLLAELVAWLPFLPWMLGAAVWTGGWPEWLRVTLTLTFAIGWIIISVPRPKKP